MSTEAKTSIKEQIHPVQALPKVLAMLTYGKAKTGKTRFGATFPKPALLIDVREKGFDSIAHIEGIDVIQLGEWSEFEDIYWYVKKEGKYKSVIIDQVTQLQDVCMEHVLESESKDVMSQRLWGAVSGLMKTWLLSYRDLIDDGINVLFIAHDRTTDSDDSSGDDQIDPSVGPRLMPSVASILNGAVKAIGNTFIREVFLEDKTRTVEYCMRIGPHAYYTTGIRTAEGTEVPEWLVNANYDEILRLMTQSQEPVKTVAKPLRRKVVNNG